MARSFAKTSRKPTGPSRGFGVFYKDNAMKTSTNARNAIRKDGYSLLGTVMTVPIKLMRASMGGGNFMEMNHIKCELFNIVMNNSFTLKNPEYSQAIPCPRAKAYAPHRPRGRHPADMVADHLGTAGSAEVSTGHLRWPGCARPAWGLGPLGQPRQLRSAWVRWDSTARRPTSTAGQPGTL